MLDDRVREIVPLHQDAGGDALSLRKVLDGGMSHRNTKKVNGGLLPPAQRSCVFVGAAAGGLFAFLFCPNS